MLRVEEQKLFLQQIKKTVSELDPKAKIILYGSRARGDARPDSDWDILILTDDNSPEKNETLFSYPLYHLELDTNQVISTSIHTLNEWGQKYGFTPFYTNIQREGIVL